MRIYSLCQGCSKAIVNIGKAIIKCGQCSTSQRAVNSKREASAQLQVKIDTEAIWLTVFLEHLEQLLAAHSPEVSIESGMHLIEGALLNVKNITVCYSEGSNSITKIVKVSSDIDI